MAKIKVPEGMLEAAMRASLEAGLAIGPSTELRIPIEAALRWLSENPIEPSLEQSAILRDLACVVSAGYGTHDPTAAAAAAVAMEWQRRMFLAPEPEVPEEISIDAEILYQDTMHRKQAEATSLLEKALLEAFNRGKATRKV